MSKRTLSHTVQDNKRTLEDKSPEWIKRYIGLKAIAMMVANDRFEELTGESILSPYMNNALKILRDYARPVKESS